ncbi:MAG TPA: glycoside hydrolase family 3 N-terminal domain-containing protein [Gemmatimonadaceae bacterium]|nr:glycoside hydrolase family 3 N-terminal domain-containing protein [Gemmatimonadaceae bacterium]
MRLRRSYIEGHAHRPAALRHPEENGREVRVIRAARALTTALLLALLVLPASADSQAPGSLPYRNPRLPVAERVADLLGRMTLEEKFRQMFMIPGDLDDPAHDYSLGIFGLQISVASIAPVPTGQGAPRTASDAASEVARAHTIRINDIQRWFVERTRLGIPIIPFDEAVHGLTRAGATVFPQAIALAATWDTALVARAAQAIARETRSRGVRQVLSPVVNVVRDVRWGRVEETYGEDAYLGSLMGRAFVATFEEMGIVTTPKHFVANVGEGGRDSYPIELSERALEEVYYPPFRDAVQRAGARSVMTAYNSVDGAPSTQNHRLLTEVLKRAWSFDGFVISDAAATGGATVLHFTEPNTPTAAKHAVEAGLDVIFQSSWPQHQPYWDAFRRGMIADSLIDASVSRVLRAKFELGLFERPYADPDSAAYWNGHAAHRALTRETSRKSIVLLRNEARTLPISRSVASVAVIGTDAVESRLGGYSGPGIRPVSILEGIRTKLGAAVSVRYAPGPGRTTREYVVIPSGQLRSSEGGRTVQGLRGEYFDNNRLDGSPRIVRTDERVDFRWTLSSPGRGIPFDWYSVRWTGTLAVPENAGVRRIGVEGNDGYRLYLDGALLIDNWRKQSYGTRLAGVELRPGTSHELRLEYVESTGNARVKLVWDAGVDADWRPAVDSAVAVARRSDVAVIVAGIEEGEFQDRAFLGLPGHQEAMIRAVAATGTPVIVVLIGGSAITMSTWLDDVGAVIAAWYPGEEGGNAVADVLAGDENPAGRLPITFPMAEGQLPLYYNHKPTGRGDDYIDLTGQPLFPFGFGLSYTEFEYSGLVIDPDRIGAEGVARVRARVRNTGDRAGDEVVQLYVRDLLASVARPVMQLAGFQRIHLAPGEEREVVFELGEEHLRMLDRDLRWVVERGTFRIMVGGSSKDIRLRGLLTVQ